MSKKIIFEHCERNNKFVDLKKKLIYWSQIIYVLKHPIKDMRRAIED